MVSLKRICVVAVVLVVLFSFLTSVVTALGVLGEPKTTITYVPGLEQTFDYGVSVPSGEPTSFSITAHSDLSDYVTIEPSLVENAVPGSVTPFSVTLQLPESDIEPGLYVVDIVAKEITDKSVPGVSAVISITTQILVKALLAGKHLNSAFAFTDVRIDKTADVTIDLDGWGEEAINSVDAYVKIYNSDDYVIDTIVFDAIPLAPGEKNNFNTAWSPKDAGVTLEGKEYEEFKAMATVNWDGNTDTNETTFRVTTDKLVITETKANTILYILIGCLAVALIAMFIYLRRLRYR